MVPPTPGRDPDRSLIEDERAIEGLPIRLVIALVVGVAALAIMLQVLNTFGGFGADSEVDVDFNGDDFVQDDSSTQTITVTVIDEEGAPVSDATVIAQSGELRLEQSAYAETNNDGNATFELNSGGDNGIDPDRRSNQDIGDVRFIVNPPSEDPLVDDQENNRLQLGNDT